MKKLFTLVLVFLLIVCSFACNNNAKIENKENSTDIQQAENDKPAIPEVKVGDKIITENMEISINNVQLTYDVLPEDTSGFYTHYPAESGKVYICIDADVTNKAKQNLSCDDIGKVTADYNDGYKYSGFVIVEDSTTGFTYANITDIVPLETMGIKWLIECPQEVEETDNSLFIEFIISGEKFIYTVR